MEARAHPVCGAAPARGRARPGGSDRRLPAWPLAAQQQPRSYPCPPQSLPRDARSALRERPTLRLIHRTAVYGPVRTVVWEGRSREAPPYPDPQERAPDLLEVPPPTLHVRAHDPRLKPRIAERLQNALNEG